MRIHITIAIFFLLNLWILFFGTPKPSTPHIIAVHVTQVFPEFDLKTGKVLGYDTSSASIFYNKDTLLFKLPYFYKESWNDTFKISGTRYHYFVYRRGNSSGVDYDDNKFPNGRFIPTDSALKHEWVAHPDIYSMIKNNDATLISKKKNKNSGELFEVYSIKGKTDSILSGSLLLSFTKGLKNIPYSLSNELDSIENMKLYKATIILDERYFQDYNITMNKYEISYLLEEIPFINEDEIMNYFVRFRTDFHASN